jgi:hypothetical protein
LCSIRTAEIADSISRFRPFELYHHGCESIKTFSSAILLQMICEISSLGNQRSWLQRTQLDRPVVCICLSATLCLPNARELVSSHVPLGLLQAFKLVHWKAHSTCHFSLKGNEITGGDKLLIWLFRTMRKL